MERVGALSKEMLGEYLAFFNVNEEDLCLIDKYRIESFHISAYTTSKIWICLL
jgi:hypothetical protein